MEVSIYKIRPRLRENFPGKLIEMGCKESLTIIVRVHEFRFDKLFK